MNVGVALQRARTERNLSLAMVTERTKIQPWILEALESGRLQEMMSPIYVKGFLTSYAKFLHLDPGPLITQFVAPVPQEASVASQTQLPPAPKAQPVAPMHIPWLLLRRLGSGLAIVAAIGAFVVINPLKRIPHSTPASSAQQKSAKSVSNSQHAAKAAAKRKSAPAETAAASVQKPAAPSQPVTLPPAAMPTEPVKLATPPLLTMASVAPISDPLKPAALPTLTLMVTQPLDLLVNAKRPTWITVRADGRLIAEQRLGRGAKEHWMAKKQFELVIAKPAEVELTLNGQPISPFAVAHRGRMLITHRGITKLPGED